MHGKQVVAWIWFRTVLTRTRRLTRSFLELVWKIYMDLYPFFYDITVLNGKYAVIGKAIMYCLFFSSLGFNLQSTINYPKYRIAFKNQSIRSCASH